MHNATDDARRPLVANAAAPSAAPLKKPATMQMTVASIFSWVATAAAADAAASGVALERARSARMYSVNAMPSCVRLPVCTEW